MEKANTGSTRRELPRAVPGHENNRIEAQKKSDSANADERTDSTSTKASKGGKVK